MKFSSYNPAHLFYNGLSLNKYQSLSHMGTGDQIFYSLADVANSLLLKSCLKTYLNSNLQGYVHI